MKCSKDLRGDKKKEYREIKVKVDDQKKKELDEQKQRDKHMK